MCGITGYYSLNPHSLSALNLTETATDSLAKRGPDSRGTYYHQKAGLGHRRLSIIDITDGASQPMSDESGRFTLVFNGEIYNYRELRKELEQEGVSFRSHSDTEVLLHMYKLYGKNCLHRLNGFFAFAIYDNISDHLFIARDRMGIKPLLYYKDEEFFAFASELKGLLAYNIPKKLNYQALYLFLQFNYVPAPLSMIKGVQKLMPGHYMEISDKKVRTEAYYTIPYQKEAINNLELSYEQQQAQLIKLLEQSVQRRLIADVPLGAFLSGGIDSSVITALASRHTQELNTFSIGYKDEPFFDETHYAQLVAKKFQTEHTVFSLSNEDLYEHLHEILDYIDEPFADSSAIPVYILSQQTKKKASVALSGDGADELFSGYNKHMAAYHSLHGGFAALAIKNLLPLWNVLPKSRNTPLGNKVRQLQRFAIGMQYNEAERYWRWASITPEVRALNLLSFQSQQAIDEQQYLNSKKHLLRHFSQNGDLNELLLTDMELVLPNDMLTKVDLMSMANGLEVRVPFLDHEVVNFAFQLPISSKINSKMKKRILQDSFREVLPPELYQRPKHGFEVPLLKWFRGDLKTLILDDLLEDEFIKEQGIFELSEIRCLKEKLFSANPEDVHAQIWGLIVFQHWWKKYFI
jgi:asparagine synthase (glutamine-hydrolysing)